MNNSSWSPFLFIAIRHKDLEKIQEVIENSDIDINQKNKRGMTPLMVAAMTDDAQVCAYLLNHGADINILNQEGKTACDYAFSPLVKAALLSTPLQNTNNDANDLPFDFEPEEEPIIKKQDADLISQLVEENKTLSCDIPVNFDNLEIDWNFEELELPQLGYPKEIVTILRKGLRKGFVSSKDFAIMQNCSQENCYKTLMILYEMGIPHDDTLEKIISKWNPNSSDFLYEDLHDTILEEEVKNKSRENRQLFLTNNEENFIQESIDSKTIDTQPMYICINQIHKKLQKKGYNLTINKDKKRVTEKLFNDRKKIRSQLLDYVETNDCVWLAVKEKISFILLSISKGNNIGSNFKVSSFFINSLNFDKKALEIFIDKQETFSSFKNGGPTALFWEVLIESSDFHNKEIFMQIHQLIQKLQETDELIMMINIHLVYWRTSSYASTYRDDLFQIGIQGLYRAIEKFDLNNNASFATYAIIWIDQVQRRALDENNYNDSQTVSFPVHFGILLYQFKKYLKNKNPTKKTIDLAASKFCKKHSLSPIASQLLSLYYSDFISYEDIAPDKLSDNRKMERQIISDLDKNILHTIEKKLLAVYDKRNIVNLRYGLDTTKEETLEEIGQTFNVTRERIRQIQQKVENKMGVNHKLIGYFIDWSGDEKRE
ncbi:MAG: sigma-70 family RNA polymerase sigma factor [Spirochaetia bacterium]|nr:sigma-70 family RNA polymerase sigma factor [Spirochaetia bacterium]